MAKIQCPLCETINQVDDSARPGLRFTCIVCSAQLILTVHDGKKLARCALCPQPHQSCNDNCERRMNLVERKGFFDIPLGGE